MLVSWYIGRVDCWYIGILIYLVYCYIGGVEYWYTGVLVCCYICICVERVMVVCVSWCVVGLVCWCIRILVMGDFILVSWYAVVWLYLYVGVLVYV